MMRPLLLPGGSWMLGVCLGSLCGCGQTILAIESDDSEVAPRPEPQLESGPEPSDRDAQAPTAAPEPEPDLELGLLAHFAFDEASAGDVVRDGSGHGHDGTPSANPPVPSPATPAVGFDNPRCLAFDGAAQLVDLAKPTSLDLSGNVTLAAWIRPRALDGFRNIVAHGFRWTPDTELVLRIGDGYYEFVNWGGGTINHRARAEVRAGDLDTWHHLAGVYDGRAYRLYRDGRLIAEQEEAVAPPTIDARWAIGGRSEPMPDEPRSFDGFIDEVRIYGRALSDAEVHALSRQ